MIESPVPFFSPDIEIGEVIAASSKELMKSEGKTIGQVSNGSAGSLYDTDYGMIYRFGDQFVEWSNN